MIRLPLPSATAVARDLPKHPLSQWAGAIGELFVPSVCTGCSAFAANGWACEACQKRTAFADATWCPACAMPRSEPHSPGCRHDDGNRKVNQSKNLPWAEARSLGEYSGVIRAACLAGKKAAGVWASSQLVNAWWALHADWAAAIGPAWLLPIPRHWSRAWLEGHDPARFLADELAVRWSGFGGRSAQLLIRRRATPHLSELTAENRFRIMAGLFATSADAARRFTRLSRVVLVDDIWTSGATAISAAQCLKQAGAKSIYLVTMARTLERHA